jgi:hypothetical protein
MNEHFGMGLIGFIIGLYLTCVVDWSVENSNKKLHESKDRLIKKQQEYIETLEYALMEYKKTGNRRVELYIHDIPDDPEAFELYLNRVYVPESVGENNVVFKQTGERHD